MSDRYPGGLIRKTPPTITPPVDGEGGSAPGIWTLEQVAYYTKEGEWPKPVLPRELYAWGSNFYGSLGQDDKIYRSSPTQVGAFINWAQVSKASSNTAAVKTDGTLWTWGFGSQGRLGLNDTVSRSSPVQATNKRITLELIFLVRLLTPSKAYIMIQGRGPRRITKG
jgi:hypothetical protein